MQQQVLSTEQKSFYALLLPVILAVFSTFLTMGIGFGVLPQFVHQQLGYGAVIVGFVIGAEDITTLLTRSMTGVNTDMKGARSSASKGIVWAVASGIVYMIAAAVQSIPTASLSLLIAARILHGLSESYLITGALTWGIGLAGVSNSGKVMAWVGIAIFGGIGLGAPLGDTITRNWGAVAAFALITILPVIGGLPLLRLPAIAPIAKKRETSFFKVIREIWLQGSSLALSAIGYGCIFSFITLFFGSRGWGDSSSAFSIFAIAFILVRLCFASFPDKYGGYKVGMASIAIEVLGQLLLWLAVSKSMALAGCALTGIGFSLMFPAMGVEAVRKVKPEMRGSAMGAYTAFTDVALAIAGPAAGLFASHYGYQSIYFFGTLCSILSLLLILFRKK